MPPYSASELSSATGGNMPNDPIDPVARLCEEWVKEQHYRKTRGIPVWAMQIALIVALGIVFVIFLYLMLFYRPA
jgi:hypothetical protein